jgi:hypothetical protein
MKNWKTTLLGLAGAVATALIPVIQGKGFEAESLAVAAALALLGFVSKDYDTTGAGYKAHKPERPYSDPMQKHPMDQ